MSTVKSSSDQAAYIITAYPGFSSMKRLGVFPLSPGMLTIAGLALNNTFAVPDLGGERLGERKVTCTGIWEAAWPSG